MIFIAIIILIIILIGVLYFIPNESVPSFEIVYSVDSPYGREYEDLLISYEGIGTAEYYVEDYDTNINFSNKIILSQREVNSLYKIFNSTEFLELNQSELQDSCANDSTYVHIKFWRGTLQKNIIFDDSCPKPPIILQIINELEAIETEVKKSDN